MNNDVNIIVIGLTAALLVAWLGIATSIGI
jgi:hypothetical protein